MKKSLQIFCKLLDYDLEESTNFDHYKGLSPKRINFPSVYLFSSIKPEKYLVCSETPIDVSLVSKYFRQDNELNEFASVHLKNYDIYFVDKVIPPLDSQESFFFTTCNKLIEGFNKGESVCLLLSGTSSSHKNYVLRGGEDKEKGILIRTYNELLKSSYIDEEKNRIYAESAIIYNENIIDLLTDEPGENQIFSKKRKNTKNKKIQISSLGELKNIFDLAHLKIRKIGEQLQDRDFFKKVHFEFSLSIEKENVSRFTIIRLKDDLFSEYELKKLKGYLSQYALVNFPEKNEDHSLFTYYLSEKNFNHIVIANIFTPMALPKSLKNLITLTINSINNNNRNPSTPHYKETLSKNLTLSNSNSNNYKEKKMLIDKDISTLLERYNNSKKMMESLPIKQPINENKQLMSLEKDILRLKSQVIDKLESTTSPKPNAETIMKISEITTPKNYPETTNKNSFQKLKAAFEEKEKLLLEKLENFKRINENLKENLKNYVEKKDSLEEELREKDGFIDELERNMKNYEDLIRNEREINNELKEKINELDKDRESQAIKYDDLQKNMEKKAQKIQLLKQKIEIAKNEENKIVEKNNNQIFLMKNANEELESIIKGKQENIKELQSFLEKSETEISQKDEKINELHHHISLLEKEISLLKEKNSEGNMKFLEINKEYESMKEKLRETKETVQLSEAKALKMKTKYEEEKKRIIQEKNEMLQVKIEKYRLFKQANKDLNDEKNHMTNLIKNYEKEILMLKSEKEQFISQNSELKQSNNALNYKLDDKNKEIQVIELEKNELQGIIQSEKNEKSNLIADLEKLKKISKNSEKKLQEYEENSLKDKNLILELKSERAKIEEENEIMKENCIKLENQLEVTENKHQQEIMELDKKFEMLIEEMKFLKEENQDYKAKEHEMRKNFITSEEENSNIKEKYIKMKFANKELKKHLKEVEEKLKDYITERHIEMKEMEINKENAQKVINNKLKILDEIQSMVKSHRVKSKNLESSGVF